MNTPALTLQHISHSFNSSLLFHVGHRKLMYTYSSSVTQALKRLSDI